MRTTKKTLCPYCGVGCGLLATSDGQRLLQVRGDPDHPANFGKLCPKGATLPQTVNVPSRLRHAMIRDGNEDQFTIVSPHAALDCVAQSLDRVRKSHGPQAIGFYLSGQLTTEAQYLTSKFAKGYLQTNHVDSNSRLCMSSAASGMTLSLGSDGPPTCYADIELADTFLFVGSNAAECHPVTFDRVTEQMRRRAAKCIVVDPRRTRTAAAATLHLAIKPATDLSLMNGLLRLLRDWEKLDRNFIATCTDGWAELNALLDEYPAQRVTDDCGISPSELLAAARILSESRKLITFWTMGVNQSIQGTFTTNAIINLHLATGQIGKPGCGPFSLTGQPNAMGGRDCGYMSHALPGYRFIADPEHRQQMEQLWGLAPGSIRPEPGHDAIRMFDALDRGELRALWIIGTNPAATMPNLSKIRSALRKAELLVVQDAYVPTETTRFAHVVLPAAVHFEQEGTFCNSERRVTLMEQILPPPADAKPDWWWVQQAALRLGFDSMARYESAEQIFDEFVRTTAGRPNDQSALHYRLLREKGPQQWPSPALGNSSERRYLNGQFPTQSGRAQFWPRPHLPPDETPDPQYPLILTTGRILHHWHTRTKTGLVAQLNQIDPGPFLQMHPADAAAIDLADGQRVQITSRRGRALAILRLDSSISPGAVFMPIHWNELTSPAASPNEVTTESADPISHQPALKHCAVGVRAA
jgi:anaerobic selenocysteine-containing dehydrogenase